MSLNTEYNQAWIAQRADPFVIKINRTYYFTASVPEYDRIVLRSADTMEQLPEAEEKEIWHCHASGPMSKHIWAPEIHYIFGKWIIYFAAGEQENIWKIRPYVLECTGVNPMVDPWVERGAMLPAKEDEFSFQAFSLDSTVLMNKGEYYYIWAEKTGVGKMISNLYIAKMKNPYQLSTVQVMLTTPDYDWERVGFWVNEGPAVLKRNGKIFLTYSASATGACYCVGMLQASEEADLLDPKSWIKERYPVLKTDEGKGIYGPGHNSFTKSEDDRCDRMVLHFRQYAEITGDPLYDPNRHAKVIEVKWNENGQPVFEF